MPDLLKIMTRKSPIELERLAINHESFVGNISRNLLTLHGYKFTPVLDLPKTKKVADLREEEINESEGKVSVFPNPAKDFIIVQNSRDNIQGDEKEMFRIINSEGKIIKEFLLFSGESRTLKTTDFRAGLYFYQLFSNEQTFETGKFLIQ